MDAFHKKWTKADDIDKIARKAESIYIYAERERERETHTEREKDRQTKGVRLIGTEREAHTLRRERERERERQTDRQTYRGSETLGDRERHIH